MVKGRRTRATPPPLPPWWSANGEQPGRVARAPAPAAQNGSGRPRAPRRSTTVGDDPPPPDADDGDYQTAGENVSPELPVNDSNSRSHHPESEPVDSSRTHRGEDTQPFYGLADALYPPDRYEQDDVAVSATSDGLEAELDLAPPPPARERAAAEMAQSPLPTGRWISHEDSNQDLYLPSARAADDSRSVRTTVDRPIAALKPVSVCEARQLAECFALDYSSCDEDDPDRRQLALEPYLARRADALLGWPGDKPGTGRRRAVQARAGEVLPYSHGITVDVKVLVEVFARITEPDTDDAEPIADDTTPAVPELPLGARWSAVPAASAPGWVHVMSIWQRLGIPVRRHDLGHLVVELLALPPAEGG